MKTYAAVIFTLVAFFKIISSQAFTFVWTPTVPISTNTYDWNEGGNWKVGSLFQSHPPTSSDDVTMTLSGASYTIAFPAGISIKSLSIIMASNNDMTFTASGGVLITVSSTSTTAIVIDGSGYTGQLISTSEFTLKTTPSTTSLTTIKNAQVNFPLVNSSAVITYQSNTFWKKVHSIVTGSTNSTSYGGNTYKDTVAFVHIGTSTLTIGYSAGEVFEKRVLLDNRSGANGIAFGRTSGNVIKDSLVIKSASTTNVSIGGSSTSAAILLQDKGLIYADTTGFVSGSITLARITQDAGDTYASAISGMVSAATVINTGPNTEWYGAVYLKAQTITLSGKTSSGSTEQNTFHAAAQIQACTGTSNGSNTFLAGLEMISLANSVSTQAIVMSNLYDDHVTGTFTLSIKGGGYIKPAWGATLYLDGNIVLGSTGSGYIQIGNSGSTQKLIQTQGKEILQNSTLGFTNGGLYLNGFQQAGSATAFTTTSVLNTNALINLGVDSETDSTKVTIKSPLNWKGSGLRVLGGQFYNDVAFESTNSTPYLDQVYSPINFFKNVSLVNSGSVSYSFLSKPTNSTHVNIWGNLTATQSSSSAGGIIVGNICTLVVLGNLTINQIAGAGNIEIGFPGSLSNACTKIVDIRGHIQLNKSGNGATAVRFGYSNSLVKHAGNKNISVGTWNYGGNINFTNFQQDTVTTGGTSVVTVSYPAIGSADDVTANYSFITFGALCIFNGPLTVTASGMSIFGGKYLSTVILNKKNLTNNQTATTGSVFDFRSTLTINHDGNGGIWYVMNHADDVGYFRGNVVLNATTSMSSLVAVRLGTGHFYGNISCNSTYAPSFGGGTGAGLVCLEGCAAQSINSTPTLVMPRLKINKSCNDVTMNANLQLGVYGDFTKGRLIVTKDVSGNFLYTPTFLNNCVSINQNINSFIDGTVRKIGTTAGSVGFTFPTGSGTIFMPLTISELCSSSSNVRATYYNTAQSNGNTLGTGVKDISNCHYWYLTQTSGTCSFTATLPWTSQTCHLVNKDVMQAVLYNGTQWTAIGANSLTGTDAAGTVTSNTATQYGYVTLGFTTAQLLDTRNVYPAAFTIGTGADNHTATYQSGPSGTAAGSSTLLSSQNNTPGILVLHPDKSISCLQTNIGADTYYGALPLCLATDAGGVVNGVTTGGNDVSDDYYSLNGNTIVFYPNKKPDGTISIVNNLSGGTVWHKTSNPTLTFTAGGKIFSYVNLKVKDVSGTVLYNGSLSYTGTALNWTGSPITAEGLYIYELSIGASSGTAKTYTGNMVVQNN